MRTLSGLLLILIASPVSPAAAGGFGAGQTDVCTVRPDLCDDAAAPRRNVARTRARPNARARGLDAQSLSLASINRPSGTKDSATSRPPRRRLASVIEQAAAGARATRALTCRPARVAVTADNASLDECGVGTVAAGRSIASETPAATIQTAAVSFNAYLHQNAANPALSRKISGYQSAFKDTSKPATLDLRGNGDDSGVRETAANAGAPPAGNQ